MVLPLTITVVACLAVIAMTRPIVIRFVNDELKPGKLATAATVSLVGSAIVGFWSAFVLATIALKNWIA
jgi:hypothetical protein